MSDRSKALAIYEWLIMHVCYDETVYDEAEETDITVAETAEYEAFYLEGVFDSGRAVCDGISKAMVLLCRMEGIPCVRVAGRRTPGTKCSWTANGTSRTPRSATPA